MTSLLSIGHPWMWGIFILFVLAMLAIDLGLFHRKSHVVTFKEALSWSIVWVSCALLFNYGLLIWYGETIALEFLTGYLIEKSLAVDNIFVFLIVFSSFAVPKELYHRVLFWGIIGALIMRAAFILVGAQLLQHFHWMLYLFGFILILSGIKMMVRVDSEIHPENNKLVLWIKKHVPMTPGFVGGNFIVKQQGKWLATPLLLVLAIIEFTDLIFAVDSIPAIFAVTSDPFIVFTSNIFAILGLRSMFFMLESTITKFHLLKYGLALILLFVGTKMCLMDFVKIPILLSLGVIGAILAGSILLSLIFPKKEEAHAKV